MNHHIAFELAIQARKYYDLCKARGLEVSFAYTLGHEDLVAFSRYLVQADLLGLGENEYLELVVEQCANKKKRPPRHARLGEDWVVELVKQGMYARAVKRKAEIRYNQIMDEQADESTMNQQLAQFEQLVRRNYEHMATKAFKPDGWKLIFSRRKGASLAKALAERHLVPDVFKHLSASWRAAFPDDIPDMQVGPSTVHRFKELFPGDLASLVPR